MQLEQLLNALTENYGRYRQPYPGDFEVKTIHSIKEEALEESHELSSVEVDLAGKRVFLYCECHKA